MFVIWKNFTSYLHSDFIWLLVAPGFPPKTLISLWFRNLPPLLNFMSNESESARFIENKVLFFYHIMYRILNSSRINMIMKIIFWSLQKHLICLSDIQNKKYWNYESFFLHKNEFLFFSKSYKLAFMIKKTQLYWTFLVYFDS